MDTSNAKTIAVVIIIAVLGFFLYRAYGGSSQTDTLSVEGVTTADGTNVATIGADIAVLLGQLNSLKIDSEIFESPAYQSLNDFTNEVPPLPQGKKNPFAPFPGAIGSAKTTKTR